MLCQLQSSPMASANKLVALPPSVFVYFFKMLTVKEKSATFCYPHQKLFHFNLIKSINRSIGI